MVRLFATFLTVLALTTICAGADRVRVNGQIETVQYDGQRTGIDLAVGDVLKVDFSGAVHDPIEWVEIAHSKQRLQTGRVLSDSMTADDGSRPVGAINFSVYFSVTQQGNETLFVRAIRRSGADEKWRQIDLKIRGSGGTGSSVQSLRPPR